MNVANIAVETMIQGLQAGKSEVGRQYIKQLCFDIIEAKRINDAKMAPAKKQAAETKLESKRQEGLLLHAKKRCIDAEVEENEDSLKALEQEIAECGALISRG